MNLKLFLSNYPFLNKYVLQSFSVLTIQLGIFDSNIRKKTGTFNMLLVSEILQIRTLFENTRRNM